jgi:hypothetical protein
MNYPPYPLRGILYRIEQVRANQNQEGDLYTMVNDKNLANFRTYSTIELNVSGHGWNSIRTMPGNSNHAR